MNDTHEDPSAELQRLREENEQLRQSLAAAETRKGIHIEAPLDWEKEKEKADALLTPLRSGALMPRLAKSLAGHAVLILVTSISFLFLRKPAESTETPTPDSPVPAETAAKPETSPSPVAEAPATNAARERVEAGLRETSDERPTESSVDLFGGDIDLDL